MAYKLMFLLCVVLLAACESEGQKAVKVAEASAIQLAAETEAEAARVATELAAEKVRLEAEVEATRKELELVRQQTEWAARVNTTNTTSNVKTIAWTALIITAAFCVCTVVVSLMRDVSRSTSSAYNLYAHNRAQLVTFKPDARGLMPGVMTGTHMLMPDTGLSLARGEERDAQGHLIAGQTQVRSVILLTGAAKAMAKHKHEGADAALYTSVGQLPVVYAEVVDES